MSQRACHPSRVRQARLATAKPAKHAKRVTETCSLHAVGCRRRTGADVSPEVREAACRFRRELDVNSLVAVAASLDQLEALPW